MTRPRSAVLYDDECGFCRWSAELTLRWDRRGKLRAVAIQSPEGDQLLRDVPAERRMGSWHLVTPDGHMFSGGAAAAPVLRSLPVGAPLARLAETFPRATESLYRAVARNRDSLGRLIGVRACAVRPGERRGAEPTPRANPPRERKSPGE